MDKQEDHWNGQQWSNNNATILINESGTIAFMKEQVGQIFGYFNDFKDIHINQLFQELNLSCIKDGDIYLLNGRKKNGEYILFSLKVHSFLLNNQTYFLLELDNKKLLDEKENKSNLIERKLKESMQELIDIKFALDSSSIVAITDNRGNITYVNDQFCHISKYKKEELLGQNHRIINSGYHSKAFFKTMWQTITNGEVWKGEVKNKAKDGTFYWVDTTIVPFLNSEGKTYQYLAIRYEITKRKQVEEDLQQMMTKLINLQEEERRSLSRELHDGVGQNLYSHLITINRLQSEINHPLIDQMLDEASELIAEIRELSWELRPSVLDDLGLVPAIRSFLSRFSDYYKIDVYFDCTLSHRLDPNKEITIYRVIQEAVTNIRKYAETDIATVTIREMDEVIRVMIEDKGIGFKYNTLSKGVGLFSMEERARAVGGNLSIYTAPGKGTRIILEVPLKLSGKSAQ